MRSIDSATPFLCTYFIKQDKGLVIPPAAKRGLSLIKDGKWLDALRFFDATANEQQQEQQGGAAPAAAQDPSAAAVASAFAALCRAHLELPEPQPTNGTSSAPKSNSGRRNQPRSSANTLPVHHLAAALRAEREAATGGSGSGAVGSPQRAASNARAAGEALAFLLHPWAATPGALPDSLVQLATEVLQRTAPGLLDPTGGVLQQQLGGGGGGGGGGLGPQYDALAKRYPSLAQMKGMVGLAPVKRAMAELAAAVRGARAAVPSCGPP